MRIGPPLRGTVAGRSTGYDAGPGLIRFHPSLTSQNQRVVRPFAITMYARANDSEEAPFPGNSLE